jgi:uncharacterized membrane protein YraQ (UPF0718 family)
LAYWLGNPILNPATMIFMGFVLGWRWTALRLVVGIVLVFGVATFANRFVHMQDLSPDAGAALAAAANMTVPGEWASVWRRWLQALWELSVGLIPEYIVLVLMLGAARAWLFPAVISSVGNNPLWILGVAVAGTFFVIPTAGEIPIVQTLMSFGLGAGPAGALLTTLPPASLPSLAMVARVFPPRVLIFITASIIVLGVLSGVAAMALGF